MTEELPDYHYKTLLTLLRQLVTSLKEKISHHISFENHLKSQTCAVPREHETMNKPNYE